MGKIKKPASEGAERKPRREKTQAEVDAMVVARGKDALAEFDVRIGRLQTMVADLQQKKEQLAASLTEAKQRLLAE